MFQGSRHISWETMSAVHCSLKKNELFIWDYYMTTMFHIFGYPLDIGKWEVTYYQIQSVEYSNVKGDVYNFWNTCEKQGFI